MPIDSLRPRKLRCGVAINDAPYRVVENGIVCPIYTCWQNMLKRCYDPVTQNKYPTYKDCTICEEWLKFSNFHTWMIGWDWKGKELDKDLLRGESKIYGPEYCCFISKVINTNLKDFQSCLYPLGVSYKQKSSDMKRELKRPYVARISINGKRKQLGVYETPYKAHRVWQLAKVEVLKSFALELEPILAQALLKIANQVLEDYIIGRVTTNLMMRK